MNILITTKRYYTNKDLIADRFGRLYHFPKFWTIQGHKVTIIAANYKSLKRENTVSDQMYFYSIPFPSLVVNFLWYAYRIAQKTKPHIIIASSDSHFGFLGLMLARKYRVPFVFDLFHHYADFGTNKIIGMKAMYYKALKGADLVVSDSAMLRKKIENYNSSHLVAEQGTDPEIFQPIDKLISKAKLNLNNNIRYLGYTGAIDDRFDFLTLIEAMQIVSQTHKNVKLLIGGPKLTDLDFSHPFIEYMGNFPQDTVPYLINSCDLMVIPYRQTKLSSTCNPCKLSEYIACKLPIVASNISNIEDYLPLSKYLLYTPGDVKALARSLLKQLENPIVEVFSESLTWESIAKKYLCALESLPRKT